MGIRTLPFPCPLGVGHEDTDKIVKMGRRVHNDSAGIRAYSCDDVSANDIPVSTA